MAYFQEGKIATTTVAGSSTDITTAIGTLAAGQSVEVMANDADIWVHVAGGTAAADAADCIRVNDGTGVIIKIEDDTTALTAIRDGATSAQVTVAIISEF